MKGIVKNYFIIKQPQQIISALVLTGILSLSTGLTLLQTATAAPSKAFLEAVDSKGKLVSDRANQLPRSVANSVRRDLSRRVGIPLDQLKVINYRRKTWPNGCLGLTRPDEVCTQALVEGWRITLSDGRSSWIYRTDSEGLVLRLEPQTASVNLPKAVADAVLQAASQQSELPISELRIIQSEQRTWSDSCLGLGGPAESCLQVLVPGWLVTVEGGQQRLVYHTNASGSVLRLNEAASQISDADTIKPVSIPKNELPPPLKEGAISRAITSGGITGRTYETNLFKDGRVLRVEVNPNGTTSQPQTYRISQQQVQKFQQLLEQQFARFNGLSYPPPSGAADYITVTFTSREGTTRYTDINQDRLPRPLQAVIQAWGQIVSGGQG